MSRRRRSARAWLLLAFVAVGLALPAASAAARSEPPPCHATAPEGPGPLQPQPCQWPTPLLCCDQPLAATAFEVPAPDFGALLPLAPVLLPVVPDGWVSVAQRAEVAPVPPLHSSVLRL